MTKFVVRATSRLLGVAALLLAASANALVVGSWDYSYTGNGWQPGMLIGQPLLTPSEHISVDFVLLTPLAPGGTYSIPLSDPNLLSFAMSDGLISIVPQLGDFLSLEVRLNSKGVIDQWFISASGVRDVSSLGGLVKFSFETTADLLIGHTSFADTTLTSTCLQAVGGVCTSLDGLIYGGELFNPGVWQAAKVPEPSSLALLVCGLMALVHIRHLTVRVTAGKKHDRNS